MSNQKELSSLKKRINNINRLFAKQNFFEELCNYSENNINIVELSSSQTAVVVFVDWEDGDEIAVVFTHPSAGCHVASLSTQIEDKVPVSRAVFSAAASLSALSPTVV